MRRPQQAERATGTALTLFFVNLPLESSGNLNMKITMSTPTLTSIFDANKENLAEKLRTYSLPRDSKKVQATVSQFLNNMFENDGAYRQSLTQSEDYILQSAIQLLRAQQSIATEMVCMASELNASRNTVSDVSSNSYSPVVGTGIGAVAGSFIGTLMTVCCAIAGTAIAIYISTKKSKNGKNARDEDNAIVNKINVNAFINIVKKICESIDGLMETYRVQVRRIQYSYEQKEETTLLNSYSALTDQIANVIKTVKNVSDEVPSKVSTAIDMLEESLENYDLIYDNGKIISNQ